MDEDILELDCDHNLEQISCNTYDANKVSNCNTMDQIDNISNIISEQSKDAVTIYPDVNENKDIDEIPSTTTRELNEPEILQPNPVILMDDDYGVNFEDVTQQNNEVQVYEDTQLTAELNSIAKISIYNTKKSVAICVNRRIYFIPDNLAISTRLCNVAWKNPKMVCSAPIKFFNFQNFESELESKNIGFSDEYVGFFGAHYWKHSNIYDLTTKDGRFGHKPKYIDNLHECFIYDDFTLIIMKNGKIIDYAIHNFKNNINELIRRYNPKKVYYAGQVGQPIHTFVNYNYQPFSEFNEKFCPIQIDRIFGVLPYCERMNGHCSFCNCLKLILNYYKEHEPRTIQFIQKIRNRREFSIEEYNRYKYISSNQQKNKPITKRFGNQNRIYKNKNNNNKRNVQYSFNKRLI